MGLPEEGYLLRNPAKKIKVDLAGSEILDPRLMKIEVREMVRAFKEDGSMDDYHSADALRVALQSL